MPSSQHQQITKIIDYVLTINPKSVLEIGIGFGKYGLLCREYLEFWKGDVDWQLPVKENWVRRIDGVEAFDSYINQHQKYIYNNIYNGDALEVFNSIEHQYDLILMIDVLEHFTYENGMKLLKKCLANSQNILVSVPKDIGLQSDVNDNKYEIHRFQFLKKHFKELSVECVFSSGGSSSLIVLLGKNSKRYHYERLLREWFIYLKESFPGFWARRRKITDKLRRASQTNK